jgi:hypothetical protein
LLKKKDEEEKIKNEGAELDSPVQIEKKKPEQKK